MPLANYNWSTIPVETQTPSARHLYSSVTSGNSVFVFGGFCQDGTALNDLYEYNFGKQHTITFSETRMEQDRTKGRYSKCTSFSHSCTL